jgi:hypothetical protein
MQDAYFSPVTLAWTQHAKSCTVLDHMHYMIPDWWCLVKTCKYGILHFESL